MADGDENDEDDDEEVDEGDEGEEGEGEGEESASQRRDTTEGLENQDKEMTGAPQAEEPSISEPADVEMKDEDVASKESTPPNPLTLAPPTGSQASGSPKVEGSPLKNVSVPSPSGANGAVAQAQDSSTVPEQLPASHPAEDSTLAEPPSTIVGEAPEEATDRDLPPVEPPTGTDEALLPPPPDQVGNIASPKASPKDGPVQEQISEGGEQVKEETQSGEETTADQPAYVNQESVMTEDTLKPDDSASVGVPATTSGAPSEAAPISTDPEPDSAPATEAPVEDPEPPQEPQEILTTKEAHETQGPREAQPTQEPQEAPPVPEPDAPAAPATNNEPDLLGGLVGELDREASEDKPAVPTPGPAQETTAAAAQAAAAEPTKEPVAEPTTEPATGSAQEPIGEPAVENEEPPEPETKDVSILGVIDN